MAVFAGHASRAGCTSSPRFAIRAILDRGNGRPVHVDCRCLAGLSGRYHRAVAVFAGRACGAVFSRRAVSALEVCHGDQILPRAAAVRAVLDVAVRYAQGHASHAACPRRLVDRRHQRALCLRRQVGKVADLALDGLQRQLLGRCVYIPGGLRAFVHDKVPLRHRVRAGVVGYVGVCRQRVAILQQLVRDDGRAVCADIHVHAAAKRAILVVDLFDAVAVGDLDPPPGVPLPQRPAAVCDCDSHVVASFTCTCPLRDS